MSSIGTFDKMSDCSLRSNGWPLVTIVIPVYGVEEFIERCLKSALNQTYQKLEIIVVNDATKDRSMDLVRGVRDDRLKIIEHTENQGLAKSRNDGILASSGEYLAFLDSDDYLDLNFVEELLGVAIKTGADIVMSQTRIIEEGDLTVLANRGGGILKRYDEKIRALPNGGSCNKLYKSDLIKDNKINFPIGKYWEDNIFTVKAVFCSNVVACTNHTSYNYIKRPGSITTDPMKVTSLKRDSLFIAKQIIDFNVGKIVAPREWVAVQVFIFSNFVSRQWLKDSSYKEEMYRLFLDNGCPLKKGGGGIFDSIFFIVRYNLLRVLVRMPFVGKGAALEYRKLRAYSRCIELLAR